MLQAHSFLWNYLWVAPNVLLLVLAVLIWRRGFSRLFPAFLVFAILSALGDLGVFFADISPSVSAPNFWRIDWSVLVVESLSKFVVMGEVLSQVLNPYPSVGRLGRNLVSGFGAVLVLLATLIAAYSHGDNPFWLISGFHLLEQTVFIVELGLIVFLFSFARYFGLPWDRLPFGILLGFGLSATVYLATWAIMTNSQPSAYARTLLDFANMATHNICVLIWFAYLLLPQRASRNVAAMTNRTTNLLRATRLEHEEQLLVLNRELERLIQQ